MALAKLKIRRKSMKEIENEEELLKEFKALIQQEESLTGFLTLFNDKFFTEFIRGKKRNVPAAAITFKNYIEVRRSEKFRDMFLYLRPSKSLCLQRGVIRKLKYQDSLKRYILVGRSALWDPSELNVKDAMQLFQLMLDEALSSHNFGLHGVICIIDMSGWSYGHSKQCTPNAVYALLSLFWKNLPLRYKAVHFVNMMFLANMMVKMMTPFLPPKLAERLFLHSSKMDSLHECLDPEILPKFLGGKLDENEAYDEEFDLRIREKEGFYMEFARRLK